MSCFSFFPCIVWFPNLQICSLLLSSFETLWKPWFYIEFLQGGWVEGGQSTVNRKLSLLLQNTLKLSSRETKSPITDLSKQLYTAQQQQQQHQQAALQQHHQQQQQQLAQHQQQQQQLIQYQAQQQTSSVLPGTEQVIGKIFFIVGNYACNSYCLLEKWL